MIRSPGTKAAERKAGFSVLARSTTGLALVHYSRKLRPCLLHLLPERFLNGAVVVLILQVSEHPFGRSLQSIMRPMKALLVHGKRVYSL